MKTKQLYDIENYDNLIFSIDKLKAYLRILKCYTEENTNVEKIAYIDLFMEDVIEELNMLINCI